jgi:hypothetical protein
VTITLDDMRSKLLPLETVIKRLEETEPVVDNVISAETALSFKLEPGWELELDSTNGNEGVKAFININGEPFQMTKDAALMAASKVGLTNAYVKKTPGELIQEHLNYWYSAGMGDTSYNALLVNGKVAAFIRPSLVSFSNIELLERVLDGIHRKYGNTEILADYKFENSLTQTNLRLILPEVTRAIRDAGMADVPEGALDEWSAGVHLSNSLTGDSQTALETYLFRWWCTNGATQHAASSGNWTRRRNSDELDVYEWAQRTVDDVLGGFEPAFESVQALTRIELEDNLPKVLEEIFTEYKFPAKIRSKVISNLAESDEDVISMYTVMQAITAEANNPDLPADKSDTLMRVGGNLPIASFDSKKAEVWDEGHSADERKNNPYRLPTAVI